MNSLDSKVNIQSKNGYLPGGTMTLTWNHLLDLVVKEINNNNRLGR